MPSGTFVRDFDGDASTRHFFPAFQTANFGQIFLVFAESRRREDGKIFLREHEVLWLGDSFHPGGQHFTPASSDFPLTPGTPFQRASVFELLD
jgi:hypothetical protein